MIVPPSQSEVFVLSADDRRLVVDGPAIVDADGNRHDVPPKVLDALRFLETALREGYAVQVTTLNEELPLKEAALVAGIAEDEIRGYIAAGQLPVRKDEDDSADRVRLEHLLPFRRLERRQRQSRDYLRAEADDDSGLEPDFDFER
ncbi:hypothetical protein Kfla_3313 [Kribbella flavida DSM 17836]|uniref:Helix-turn-helix domain-containing protein n=1 Tax=Kribbella flavida (strain DSM 17836 / JCM 10339 / NBRC 14399) TaxID=479435 RepID=D2PKQ7_KRIFD|nr:hypothetical protein [Kribbella flavida]ADB32374.1 hypothetical protein Kfla_3313 [Kribbella flavida DSM 17836]